METIILKTREGVMKIKMSDLFYISSQTEKPHSIKFVTKYGTYEVLGKLNQLEEKYPECLIRCHRNCLVNRDMIRSIHLAEKTISLGDKGEFEVTFSRRRYRSLLDLWLKEEGED